MRVLTLPVYPESFFGDRSRRYKLRNIIDTFSLHIPIIGGRTRTTTRRCLIGGVKVVMNIGMVMSEASTCIAMR